MIGARSRGLSFGTATPSFGNGEAVTASNFEQLGFKVEGGLVYPPAFQQILKGLPAVNYTSRDLIYRPMNLRTNKAYGLSPVEQVVATVNIAMRRTMSQLDYFKAGNQPDAIFGLPETWSPDQVQRFQDYWDNLFSGNLANRRRMKFIPAGAKSAYTPTKEPPLKTEMDEWLVRIVCFSFSYPPTAFVSLANRSIAEQHDKTAEEEGLQSTKLWFSDMANAVIADEFSDETTPQDDNNQ